MRRDGSGQRSWLGAAAASACIGALAACAGPQVQGQGGGGEPPAVVKQGQTLDGGGGGGGGGDAAKPGTGWDCSGTLVPPTGWLQETATVSRSEPDAGQRAVDLARGRLVSRLCGGGSNCDALAARVDPWKRGESATEVCAMVTIEAAEVERWRKASTTVERLDTDLEGAAKALVGEKAGVKVVIGGIVDAGVPGGARAEWLAGRMNRALGAVGARVLLAPKEWDGSGLPSGVDVVIQATTVERSEGQTAVVEVLWTALVRSGRSVEVRTASAVTFARDAAPAMTSAVTLFPPNDPGLKVRLSTSHPGGGLCIGETTQLFMTSDADLHVRVFDLYGEDGALLLFPNAERPDGRVRKGETIKLGGEAGFQAVPVPGSEVERFLVIAAPREEGLGRYKGWKDTCRVPQDVAAQLHRAQGLPQGSRSSSDGFRLISGSECRWRISDAERASLEEQLREVPLCP